MRRLNHVALKKFICEYRAADRRDADSLALYPKLVYRLCDEAVHNPVRAARAICQRHVRLLSGGRIQALPSVFALLFGCVQRFDFFASISSGDGQHAAGASVKLEGSRQFIASRTSSIIWPMLSSATSTAAGARTRAGGVKLPLDVVKATALSVGTCRRGMPFLRAASIYTVLQTRAVMPYATTQISASSIPILFPAGSPRRRFWHSARSAP